MIYLDHTATAPVCDEAKKALIAALDIFGNPSSLHRLGIDAQLLVSKARQSIANAIKADEDSIYFTSCATESNNTAIFGVASALGKRKKRIVISGIEHPSALECALRLEAEGFEVVKILPDENGEISAKTVFDAVDEKTLLVSMMLVNNETGYILPVSKAFSMIKKRYPDVVTHCDAVQGFLKIPFTVKNLCADLISVSGHKVMAPKGVGALYIKKGTRINPFIVGGGQEKNMRSGTENVTLISAFGAAVDFLAPAVKERLQKTEETKAYLLQKLENVNGAYAHSFSESSPYIVSITAENIKSETLLHYLESKEIYVSSGSACSKGKKSSVLAAFHYTDRELDSTIRVSLCADTTKEDIDTFIAELENAISSLCKIR